MSRIERLLMSWFKQCNTKIATVILICTAQHRLMTILMSHAADMEMNSSHLKTVLHWLLTTKCIKENDAMNAVYFFKKFLFFINTFLHISNQKKTVFVSSHQRFILSFVQWFLNNVLATWIHVSKVYKIFVCWLLI